MPGFRSLGPPVFLGRVPVNKELFTGRVPVNKELITGTLPVNNLFRIFICFDDISFLSTPNLKSFVK